MNIELLCIGKTKMKFIEEGIKVYTDRLRHYINFRINCLPDIKKTGKLTEKEQKEKEGELMAAAVAPGDHLVLLDERGKQFTSMKFAEKLENYMNSGKKKVIFAIGGPYGFSERIYRRSDEMLSLSEMTFNHEMIRLFFTEQIYRGMTILKGEPYHHQ